MDIAVLLRVVRAESSPPQFPVSKQCRDIVKHCIIHVLISGEPFELWLNKWVMSCTIAGLHYIILHSSGKQSTGKIHCNGRPCLEVVPMICRTLPTHNLYFSSEIQPKSPELEDIYLITWFTNYSMDIPRQMTGNNNKKKDAVPIFHSYLPNLGKGYKQCNKIQIYFNLPKYFVQDLKKK